MTGPRPGPSLTPAGRIAGFEPYRPSGDARPGAVRLHANEGSSPLPGHALGALLEGLDLARYPSAAGLEARLAEQHGVEPEQVVVTAGADDALFRLCLAILEPGRNAVLTAPTFEMIPRYVRLAGAAPIEVPWLGGPFPEDDFSGALARGRDALAFVVSPSSPAGQRVDTSVLRRLAARAADQGSLLVADLAYTEFADEDPTDVLVQDGRACVTRTFSKALGLAGLRVGYAVAPASVANWLRAVGQPFSVSVPALALAFAVLERRGEVLEDGRRTVLRERAAIFEALEAAGAQPVPSEANFVLARLGAQAPGFVKHLAEAGLRVRAFGGPGPLEGAVRISCPQDQAVLERLLTAIQSGVQLRR